MSSFLYIFIETLVISLCLWASVANFRLWNSVKHQKTRIYYTIHFMIGVYWICAGIARLFWAIFVGWQDGSIWPHIWLTIWFVGSALYGLKTDADLQISRWHYWKDIVKSNNLLGKKSILILCGFIAFSFVSSLLISIIR